MRALAACAVLAGLRVSAGDPKLIKVGKGDWCPYVCEASDAGGKLGYAAHMIRTIFGKAGYKVEFVSVNYPRGIKMVRDGEHAIMACMYREDAPDLVFPKVPLGKSVNSFFVKSSNPWRFKGLQSLKGVRIGLVHGYTYPEFQEYVDSHPDDFEHLTGASPLQRMLQMMRSGRLDATFDDRNVVLHQARRLGLRDSIVEAGGFGRENPVLIGFSPGDPRTPALVETLEKGVVELRANGELAEILGKYGLSDWEETPADKPPKSAPGAAPAETR